MATHASDSDSDNEQDNSTPLMNSSSSSPSSSAAISVLSFPSVFVGCPAFASPRGLLRVASAAFALGIALATGIAIYLFVPGLSLFGLYIFLMSLFHWLEFVLTALFHDDSLSVQAFLLNHSNAFHIATAACVGEYFIELWMVPSLKTPSSISLFGLFLSLLGQSIRSLSMFQAGAHFTHLIAERRTEKHQLVTTGIYGYVRHPSYLGWFIWCLGTQITVQNPLCLLAYALVAFQFFKSRIVYEENKLVSFFGQQYRDYQKQVYIGLPFIQTQQRE